MIRHELHLPPVLPARSLSALLRRLQSGQRHME